MVSGGVYPETGRSPAALAAVRPGGLDGEREQPPVSRRAPGSRLPIPAGAP